MKTTIYFILFLVGVFACEKDDELSSDPTDNNTIVTLGDTLYVNIYASGNNNGISWEDAFTSLETALDSASEGQQIWVASGTYYPTDGTDREISFQMKEGVNIFGGFEGNETSLDSRDWENNLTILSGDIGNKGVDDDNSNHVVSGADNAILDGFIIENGNSIPNSNNMPLSTKSPKDDNHTSPEAILASGGEGCGAGLLCFQSSPIIRNVTIKNCQAAKGGAAYNMTINDVQSMGSNNTNIPVYINVKFIDNYAVARGGAVSNDLNTNPMFINCAFEGNECDSKGGAIYNDFGCSPVVANTTFTGNTAYIAAVFGNDGSSQPVIVNSTITGNTVYEMGAALYQGSYAPSTESGRNIACIINSTVQNNSSETHGLVSVDNWGKSWVESSGCTIDGWDFETPGLASDFANLINAANTCKNLKSDEIYDNYITTFKSSVPERAVGGPADFIDYTIVTNVTIPQNIIYVNINASGSNNGSSWTNAYTNLQDGIDAAYNLGGGEVWIAQGTYLPGSGRESSFIMKEYVAIYGGFKGTETLLSERNFENNQTILSGDIGSKGYAGDNSYHVIQGSENSIIDGVYINDGYADGELTDGFGGGLFNYGHEMSVIVKNTTFQNNYGLDGGAIYNFYDAYAYFNNITIKNNTADLGGAIVCRCGSSILVENSTIENNTAEYRAGAVLINYGSNAKFNNVTFSTNTTKGNGGAVWIDDQASQYGGTFPKFTSCTFTNNHAEYFGGGIHCFDKAEATVSNCSFSGNSASKGGDLAATLSGKISISGSNASDIYTDESSSVN